MKKTTVLKSLALSLVAMSGIAMAAAPDSMQIANMTCYTTNAYVHNTASQKVLGPYSSESIPWDAVTHLCHGSAPLLASSSDPCAFEVYATTDSAAPKQIDVGTVTMYLSDGRVLSIHNNKSAYGLKIVSVGPGHFAMVKS